jgi:formate hydrogenlyase transcriptional activator
MSKVRKKGTELEKTTELLHKEIEAWNFSGSIIEAIPGLFYVIDEKATLIKWNKNVELVTGYSPEELRGRNVLEYFVNTDDWQFVQERIKEVFTKGKSTAYVNYKIKGGKTAPYFFTGVRTCINDKYYQIGVGIDCAVLEEARKALREIDERLSLAADSAEAGLWAVNFQTNDLWMTQKCIDLHGMNSCADITYESFLNAIDPKQRSDFQSAVDHTIRTGEDLKFEYRIVLPREEVRWMNVRGRLHSSISGAPERLMGVSIDITDRKSIEEQLKERMQEVVKLKKQLEKDNFYLREEVKQLFENEDIISVSDVFKNIMLKAAQVAPTDSTVLILGETGTGKEVLARAIHNISRRSDRPLVTVNCASLPASLIESELFGREKGAYTGALTKMAGRFEVANGSTLFLDEIGEFPFELQSKLLRVIELGRFERLGSTKTVQVNVRIIAATNRDLFQAVQEGRFRQDLYYRLNVFPIRIPPLRERKEAIPALAWAFVGQMEKKLGKHIESIPQKTMDALQAYSWPGNVRELKNVIEHGMIISNKTLNALLPKPIPEEVEVEDLKELQRRHIYKVLEKTGWRMSGKYGAAEILNVKRTSLISKMKALDIKRQNKP